MKKMLLTVIIFLSFSFIYAQKQLWGVTQQSLYADEQGNIVKFDMNGENAVTIHHLTILQEKYLLANYFGQ